MSNEQIKYGIAKSGIPLDRIYRNGRNSHEYREVYECVRYVK